MPEHKLGGKGMYLYDLARVGGATPQQLVTKLVAAGLKHIYVKIADGSRAWPRKQPIFTDKVVAEAKNNALTVWGWHYVRGNDPAGEAKIAIKQVTDLGLAGYIYDGEAQHYGLHKDAKDRAKKFVDALRAGLQTTPFGFSSDRFPKVHPNLPAAELAKGADVLMPQVYWEGRHDPAKQLKKSIDQWKAVRNDIPIIPTGSAYRLPKKGWVIAAKELQEFCDDVKTRQLPAIDFWDWDNVIDKKNADLLKVITDLTFP